MRIRLGDITEKGVTLSERLDPAAMKLDTAELKFAAPPTVTAAFQKERETVMVQVEAVGQIEMTCGRCLEVYKQPYDDRFSLGYDVKGELFLDVTDDIRQEILLSYPALFICREECLGLCPRCGKNLNEGPCNCKRS